MASVIRAQKMHFKTCTRCANLTWLGLGCDAIPDETTILNFRRLLERHALSEALFAEVSSYLEKRALLLRGGTIMDATLIAATPSPKNKAGKRDNEMAKRKKVNQWYFGAKMHVGMDARSGLVHTAKMTKASRRDAALTDKLIRDDDRAVFGDNSRPNKQCCSEVR